VGSYLGKHAEFYDIFYKDKPYSKEAAFVDDLLKRHAQGENKTLLELACGTGRHAFEFEKLSYQVLATDYSQDLLQVARQKADALQSKVTFELQDMRSLPVPELPYDAVVCLFDSIGYVQTNEAILQVLAGVRKNLQNDGLFVFEFWHAAAMLRNYEQSRQRKWQFGSGEILRTSNTRLEVSRQLAHVTYDIVEFDEKQQRISELKETQTNRYFLVQEMAALLQCGGLMPVEFVTAYEDAPITEDTWHILGVARK
jgi:SAM-dependent methyltransferase